MKDTDFSRLASFADAVVSAPERLQLLRDQALATSAAPLVRRNVTSAGGFLVVEDPPSADFRRAVSRIASTIQSHTVGSSPTPDSVGTAVKTMLKSGSKLDKIAADLILWTARNRAMHEGPSDKNAIKILSIVLPLSLKKAL